MVMEKEAGEASRFSELIRKEGLTVHIIHTLSQAYKTAYETKPDLIIVNIDQPVALKVCKDLRADVETCLIEILLILDEINEDISKQVVEIGIEKVIQRNIDDEEFIRKVRELLSFKNQISS